MKQVTTALPHAKRTRKGNGTAANRSDSINVGFGGIQTNGRLAVQGDATFRGRATFQNATDSNNGFDVLDAAGNSISRSTQQVKRLPLVTTLLAALLAKFR